MDDLERARRTAERAEREYLDREETASGHGYDVDGLRKATREISKLLCQYRAGELDRGSDTGDFVKARACQSLVTVPICGRWQIKTG